MTFLIGYKGYVGRVFERELIRRKIPFMGLSRADHHYDDFDKFYEMLRLLRPSFVINVAGFAGKPNVDQCELHQSDCIQGNVILPVTIANACTALNIPCGHVSSGCLYNGLVESGYKETDPPNFNFRSLRHSFYSACKALAEETLVNLPYGYLWRLRLPFDEHHSPRNYLDKLWNYERVYQATNSISHLGDFVNACLDCWEQKLPYGIYNLTNPGYVRTSEIVGMIQTFSVIPKTFNFFLDDNEFYKVAKAPRSNCVLNTDKAIQAGLKLRPIEIALEQTISAWCKTLA